MLPNLQRIILYRLDYRTLAEHWLGTLLRITSGLQVPNTVVKAMNIIGVIPAYEALAAVVLGSSKYHDVITTYSVACPPINIFSHCLDLILFD
jgi:hypothetical protein